MTIKPRVTVAAIPKGRTCLWSRADEDTDCWEGSCGAAWSLNDGTPEENEMNYCPRCGAKLEQAKAPSSDSQGE